MSRFTIDSYNFFDDELFQQFFKKHLPDEYISRDKYIRRLIRCKRDWIDILNSPPLRHACGVPLDWGYDED